MVPQPLAELRGSADEVRHHTLGVTVAGVIATVLMSWLVSGYVSRRLQGVLKRLARWQTASCICGWSGRPDWTRESSPSCPKRLMRWQSRSNVRATSNSKRARAEAANRAKSDFHANISHELRTLLNAIIGFSEAIETEVLGPVGVKKYQKYAGDIHHSDEHLHASINDFHDMSKVESASRKWKKNGLPSRNC